MPMTARWQRIDALLPAACQRDATALA